MATTTTTITTTTTTTTTTTYTLIYSVIHYFEGRGKFANLTFITLKISAMHDYLRFFKRFLQMRTIFTDIHTYIKQAEFQLYLPLPIFTRILREKGSFAHPWTS